ncbi:hypothetical protein ACIQOV_06275 [Kitasatospora sp. NPDC091257]|uniref:hypothetical protein n=1 Tax=Kitasatospora sp. NPDC091257 TaxID=3364084 RepID=UPI00381BC543
MTSTDVVLGTYNVTAWGHLPAEGRGRATQQVRNLLMTLDDTRTASIRYLIRKMPAASSRPSSAAAQ